MKKKLTALFLALCLALSLAACSSGGSGAQPAQTQEAPQTQEPSSAESNNTEAESSEPSDELLAKMTDEQREKYEEYLESKKQEEENKASEEVNEYGITDAELQSLVEAIKAHVTDDYLNVYSVSPSDFSWPEADTDFWRTTCSIINLGIMSSFGKLPDELYEHLSDEEAPLAKALMSGIAEWEDKDGGKFYRITSTLYETDKVIQFFLDNVTFE